MTLRARHFFREHGEVGGLPVRLTTYVLGTRWICRVDDVAPGAVMGRGFGTTREQAIRHASRIVTDRLEGSRSPRR